MCLCGRTQRTPDLSLSVIDIIWLTLSHTWIFLPNFPNPLFKNFDRSLCISPSLIPKVVSGGCWRWVKKFRHEIYLINNIEKLTANATPLQETCRDYRRTRIKDSRSISSNISPIYLVHGVLWGGEGGVNEKVFCKVQYKAMRLPKKKNAFFVLWNFRQKFNLFSCQSCRGSDGVRKKKERHSGDWNMESRKGFSAVPRFMILKKIKIKIEEINLSNLRSSWARVIVPKGLHALLSENTLYIMVSNLHIGKISLENFPTKNNNFI